MADRMRVTSLIGGTTRLEGRGGSSPPESLARVRESRRSRHVGPGEPPGPICDGKPPLSVPPARPQVLHFFGTPPVREPPAGQLPCDAGLLPAHPFGQRIGLTRAFADALDDPRRPALPGHTFRETVRARGDGI